jgi:protein ECT2
VILIYVVLAVPVMPVIMKEVTPRQQVFHELVTTESNYVAILDSVFKISEEAENPDQQGGALLDQQEMKIIFSNLVLIRKVHTDMLKKLHELELNWTDESCIGSVILEFSEDLLKAYPPFVNFFEQTKSQILECDRRSPRFHAFLKKCERRPECSRQTLTELMIRPVQRLPSMSLLLNDLLKHTKKLSVQLGRTTEHRDVGLLEVAIDKVKTVMTHLNEEKRRTEGQITIFDIYSEIENCPASVVSSHRSFVSRYDCIEVAAEDVLCGKGYELTLFLFTDILLIAKKKTGKMGGMIRSPSNMSIASGHVTLQTKALKFVSLLHLSSIQRVVDILDSPDVESGVVALVYRQTEDLEKRSERCYTVQLQSETQDEKLAVLRTICRHVANTMCRPDPENLLVRLGAKDMALDASDLIVSSLSRTFSSLYKTKQKFGRAFSFNRTPGTPN